MKIAEKEKRMNEIPHSVFLDLTAYLDLNNKILSLEDQIYLARVQAILNAEAHISMRNQNLLFLLYLQTSIRSQNNRLFSQ